MPDMYRVLVEQLTGQFNVPEEELTPQSTLSGAGLDSLALLELVTILENEYEHPVELEGPDAPGPASTLAEVAAWLERSFGSCGDDGALDGDHGLDGGHEAATNTAGQGAR